MKKDHIPYIGDTVMPKKISEKKIIGKLTLAAYKCGGCGKGLPLQLSFGKTKKIRCKSCLDYNVMACHQLIE
ncbi:hypothetical protein [Candidatus Uabimicrobium sp. HlEnr_7]|uniref:hypothetical protein n=1 Tax=Candidatus Uabimicrobium helgolandensis TaxID=3095367 RepID=UPI0035582EAA